MGILTDISREVDEQNQLINIYAVTKFGISSRSALNRVASRAAIGEGVGQRTLVAAAYNEEGIDMVWRDGPASIIDPEEKWPEAKDIEYTSVKIDAASETGDITNIPKEATPRGKLTNLLFEDINEFREGQVLHVWKIPYEIAGEM